MVDSLLENTELSASIQSHLKDFYPNRACSQKQIFFWKRRILETISLRNMKHIGPGVRMFRELRRLFEEAEEDKGYVSKVVLGKGVHNFFVDIVAYPPYQKTVTYEVDFAREHPFKGPTIRTLQPIFHPLHAAFPERTVSYGCHHPGEWSPAMKISDVLRTIQCWLSFPDGIAQSITDGPILNLEALQLFMNSPDDFFDRAILMADQEK
jgi:ubiquitin-protein ligase